MLSPQDEEFLKEFENLDWQNEWTENTKRILRIVAELKAQLHILETGGNSPNEMDQEIQRLRKERDALREALIKISDGSTHSDSDISGEGCHCPEKFAKEVLQKKRARGL